MPAVAAAAKAGVLLVVLAGAFLAWACLRAGMPAWIPAAIGITAAALVAGQCVAWRRASLAPVRRLEASPDGSLWLCRAGRTPVPVAVGRGTRLLGPSVFLDLHVAGPGSPSRLQCWITPFDVPGRVMRQWSVVLPRGGRVACS